MIKENKSLGAARNLYRSGRLAGAAGQGDAGPEAAPNAPYPQRKGTHYIWHIRPCTHARLPR